MIGTVCEFCAADLSVDDGHFAYCWGAARSVAELRLQELGDELCTEARRVYGDSCIVRPIATKYGVNMRLLGSSGRMILEVCGCTDLRAAAEEMLDCLKRYPTKVADGLPIASYGYIKRQVEVLTKESKHAAMALNGEQHFHADVVAKDADVGLIVPVYARATADSDFAKVNANGLAPVEPAVIASHSAVPLTPAERAAADAAVLAVSRALGAGYSTHDGMMKGKIVSLVSKGENFEIVWISEGCDTVTDAYRAMEKHYAGLNTSGSVPVVEAMATKSRTVTIGVDTSGATNVLLSSSGTGEITQRTSTSAFKEAREIAERVLGPDIRVELAGRGPFRGLVCVKKTGAVLFESPWCPEPVDCYDEIASAFRNHPPYQSKETAVTDAEQTSPILKTLEVDATEAAWRMAGSQFVKLAKEPIVALLSRHLGPDDESLRARIAAFLDTELGTAILTGILSGGLSAMPMPPNDVSQRLSRELRVRSMATAGDAIADVLMGPLRQVAVTYLQGQPPVTVVDPAELVDSARMHTGERIAVAAVKS